MPDGLAVAVAIAPQPFESDIFAAPVWRADVEDGASLTDLGAVTDRARREGVALIACRVPEGAAAMALLPRAGFRPIERLLTFERALPEGPAVPADVALPEEADAVAEIGQSIFVFGRYHADPEIPDAIADEFKRQWIRNGVRGRADAAIVARFDRRIAGFILCMRREAVAIIDLIGVDSGHRRRGIGRWLVRRALSHYAGRCSRMRVGTQAANTPSITLYESEGFVPVAAAQTFHWTP